MNLHCSSTEKDMQELNVEVKVDKFPETVHLDIAGLSSLDDFEGAITAEVEEFLDSLDETALANIEMDEKLTWEVTHTESCDAAWVFGDTFAATDWEWQWVEYFGKKETKAPDICEAAEQLSVASCNVEEAYVGEFCNDEKFAEHIAQESGALLENPSWPNDCIDWEKAARELMMDYSEQDGHYFRSM